MLSLVPAYALFFILTSEFLVPVWIYILVAFFVFLFLLMKGQRIELRLGAGNAFIVLWTLSSLCCAVLFSSFMNDRRRSEIEARADELAHPVDGWSKVLVDQSMATIRMAMGEISIPAQANGMNYKFAFALWSGTTLSEQPNNSAVLISDSTGKILSEFFVGINPGLATSDSILNAGGMEVDTGVAQLRTMQAGGPKLYVGRTRATTASMQQVVVTVALEPIDPVQMGRSRVDPLRNTASGFSPAPEDNFDIRTFELRASDSTIRSGPGGLVIARGAAVASFLSPGYKQWMPLPGVSGASEYFLVPVREGDVVSLIGVAPGQPDWLITLYRGFRLALIFLLIGMALRVFARGRRTVLRNLFPLRFGTRLQLAFLGVSVVPVLILWFSAGSFLQSNADADLTVQLKDRIATLRESLRKQLRYPLTAAAMQQQLSDADCYAISAAAGIPMNVYIGSTLSATSNPELYHTGLLNSNLKPSVYMRIYLLGSDFVFAHERIGSFTYAVGYGALQNEDGSIAAVISAPTLFEQSRIEASTTRAFAAIFLFMAAVMVMVIAIGRILTRQISRPMTELLNGTRAVAAGDFNGAIPVGGAPETREVIAGFNRMTDQLRLQRTELASYERELAWRDMAKQVAHEIRNPLTPLRLAVQHLRRAWFDKKDNFDALLPEMTDMMIERIDALASISDEFARFARMPERVLIDVDVVELLQECVNLFSRQERIAVTLQADGVLPRVRADRDELSRVFINLVRNAEQAVGDAGDISITASATLDTLLVSIRDSGPGIAPEILPKIFEPNFSTKTGGMGLGLAIARRAVNDINGSITVDSPPGMGAEFIIRLPVK